VYKLKIVTGNLEFSADNIYRAERLDPKSFSFSDHK